MFSNIRIILVGTTHPGNIGAAARAMKNMGLNEMYLVAPKFFPHHDATARAAGADDILAKAVVTHTLDDALTNCKLIIGSSCRLRSLPITVLDAKQCANKVVAETKQNKTALVFGNERAGLTNDELLCCHYHVHIPTVKNFSSLNLAAAVQIIAYEIYMAGAQLKEKSGIKYDDLASAKEMALFYEHLEKTLIDLEFLKSGLLINRLKRLFNRARPEKIEINILRGILTSMQRKME